MKHEYTVSYGRVLLRPLAQTDTEELRLLRNRKREFFLNSTVISAETQKKWYQQYLEKPGDYMFSICHGVSGKWIGAVGIYDVEPESGMAEFGRLLIGCELVTERGLGTDATKAACVFAFQQLRLKRLKLNVYHDNTAALVTYLKAGFLPIGLEKQIDGKKLLHMEKILVRNVDQKSKEM